MPDTDSGKEEASTHLLPVVAPALPLTLSALAHTATNAVRSGGRKGLMPRSISAHELARSACSGLTLTSIRAINGSFALTSGGTGAFCREGPGDALDC